MKRVFRSAFGLSCFGSNRRSRSRARRPSVVGTWDMVVESPQGKRPSTLMIKQEGDKLSAVVKGARGERPLDSITLKGDEITMVMKVQFQGSDMVITYTGKVEKEMMKGKADFGGLAEGDWSATPQKEGAEPRRLGAWPVAATAPASPAPAGRYNWHMERHGRDFARDRVAHFHLQARGRKAHRKLQGPVGRSAAHGDAQGQRHQLFIQAQLPGRRVHHHLHWQS